MKKLKLFFACLLMAVLSIGQVWAAEDEVHKFDSSNETREVGLNNNAAIPAIEISAPAYPIKKVAVNCKYNKANLPGVTISVTVGGEAFGDSYTFNTKETKTIDFTGASAASGDVVISFVNNSGTGTGKGTFYVYYVELTEGASGGTPTCATPTFDPEDGETFSDDIDVEIASATDGATIYYTTDGEDPTTSSDVYTTALNFTETTTLKAMAVKEGSNNSAVATATYTKVVPFSGSILEIVKGDFTTSSYDDNAGDHEKSGITFTTAKVYQSGGGIQFQKTNGLLYNKTDLGEIAKIEITTVSGKSNNLVVYSGTTENPTSGAVTGSTSGSVTTYTFAAGKGFFAIKCNSTGASNVDPIKIYYTSSTSSVAKPTISGDENFVGSTTVTITHADADAIYYTTDGSDPKTSGTKQTYSVPFTVNADGTTTVKAYAVKGSDESAVAEKTFTKVTPMTTAAELRTFATSNAQNAFIQLDGWKVTFVNGNNAYMIDPSNEGVILNNASHGYVAGEELNDEVVEASVKLASGRVQLSGFTSTDITATSGTVSPVDVTDFSTVLAANQSRLITLKNATYASADGTFSDGTNTIYYYDQFSASPTLVDGTTYDVTGIVIYYKNNTTEKVQIAPRTSADVVATTPVVIPTAANLAALKAAARGTYILTLENAVVSYVNGKNAFIEDATGGALIYFQDHGFTAGDCLNGEYQVTTEDYQGKFEITAMEPQTGAAKTTAEIPLTTVSIATLNASFGSYESRRVKIVGADVTDGIGDSDRNGAINDGAALAVYAGVTNTITLTVNDNVDIIGYPGFHNTDQQLTVWAQADITVNVKEDPELAYNPTVVNVLLSDLASFTPAVLEYATGFDGVAAITYESSDPSIATVGETTGVVEVVATAEGSATITASFPGNPTYKVDNASYTINVSATPIAPVYTMSFDLTRASYDAAADAQVVWNSSVVTMTADKNDGTKVTNYLAGNYSGTTLIKETRFYTNNSLSFVPQSGVTITKIEWMSTAKGYATKLAAETFVNATAVVDGTDDKLVIITPSAAGEISVTLTDAARATGITVYYTAESEKAKLPASISIDDMNMAVGDDDILLSAIAATSNPNKKAISYAVTSGTAVTIEGTGAEAALHAAAEGSATITATIPDDLGNYTGATTSFMITVAAAATLESIAISGEATELVYTEGQSFNPAGLTVMGHYSNGSDAEITEGFVWAFDPDPLTEGTTSVSVTATVGTVTSDPVVVDGLAVSGPAPVGDNYVKVTASQTDWSGDYILVYEDGTDAYVWNGDYSDGASNYASATISSNTIAKPAAAAVITIAAASEGKYTLQVNGDKYFQDNGSNAKLIFTDAIEDAAEVTISYETDWTKLLFSERCIRFNNTSGQTRFRFYAANNQQAVQLYKKETAPEPVYTEVRGGLTAGKYYTICYNKTMTAIQGASLWQFIGKDASFAYIEQATAPYPAGTPYIIYAESDKLEAELEEVASPVAGSHNGLYGTFSQLEQSDFDNIATTTGKDVYFIYNKDGEDSELRKVNGQAGNWIRAYRAYVIVENIPNAPANMPAHVRSMPLHKDATQGFENLDASEKPLKVMIDGTLYILRGEKVYDATGRLVK